MSRILWVRLMKEHGYEEPYKSLSKEYEAIADSEAYKTPEKLIENIITIVKKIKNARYA